MFHYRKDYILGFVLCDMPAASASELGYLIRLRVLERLCNFSAAQGASDHPHLVERPELDGQDSFFAYSNPTSLLRILPRDDLGSAITTLGIQGTVAKRKDVPVSITYEFNTKNLL